MMSSTLDTQQFRHALGQFATGITIITTIGHDGRQIGMTANSFNSVSMHPPLVLWSLTKKSSNFDAFKSSLHFGVSVLAHDQEGLAHRFASYKGDRFEGVPTHPSPTHHMPLIQGAVAHFECKTRSIYDEGDHIIIIGEVIACAASPAQALIYHAKTFQHSLPPAV